MKPWEVARTLSIPDLYRFKGQVIPWPPSNEDVLWWGRVIKALHDYKESLNPDKKSNERPWQPGYWQEQSTHVYGCFGECAFGVRYGLRPPDLKPWPNSLAADFIFGWVGGRTTIDIKTKTLRRPVYEIYNSLSLAEIEWKEKKKLAFCDIYVCAWLPTDELLMENVQFLGWNFKEEILAANVYNWNPAPARGIPYYDMRPMEDLQMMMSGGRKCLYG